MSRALTPLLLLALVVPASAQPEPGLPDPGLPEPGLPDPSLPDPSLPDSIQGAFRTAEGPLPFTLVHAADSDDYGGLLVLDMDEARYQRLVLRRTETGWELEVRIQEAMEAREGGVAGTIAGDARAQVEGWRWSAPTTVALSEGGPGLLGQGYALQNPDTPVSGDSPQPEVRLPLGEDASDRRPDVVVYGHRGLPTIHPENTIPSLEAAIEEGANGVEIDLCLTRDGEVVLWHDSSTGGMVSLLRNLGFEGGMAYMPNYPPLGSSYRRPVHELTLAELRAHYGYSPRRFTLGDLDPEEGIHIPTLDEAGPVLARLDKVILDIKVPEVALIPRFVARLEQILERHGLVEKAIVMHPEQALVDALSEALPAHYAITHDVEIMRIWGGGDPEDYSAVAKARERGLRVCSIGRPRIMLWGGWKLYSKILRHDRALIDARREDMLQLAWTLNDDDELREAFEIGVDGVITDHPARALRMARAAGR